MLLIRLPAFRPWLPIVALVQQSPTDRQWAASCLDDRHDFSAFECGVESLDRWLRNEARPGHRSGASRTHVWTEPGDARVKGYYTITPTAVRPEGLSRRNLGGLSGDVPGYLLAKLALSQELRGRQPRLGPDLLLDALETIVNAADAAGGRLIVVDTLDAQAHAFYERADFQSITGSDRLVMRVSTARDALGRS